MRESVRNGGPEIKVGIQMYHLCQHCPCRESEREEEEIEKQGKKKEKRKRKKQEEYHE